MTNVFDITQYGAVSDGTKDCSEAIQKALDDAGACCGCVIVPPGKYLCANLRMHRNTSLRGFDGWSFRGSNSSVLLLSDDSAKCLLDITGAVGCTISNLGFDGQKKEGCTHGIMINHPIYDAAGEEDTPTIENCFVGGFSGNAVHFNHTWCGTLRNNMFAYSENGLYHDGWDLFVSGNWFSGNRSCGYKGGETCSAVIFTGNRIEFNREAGVSVKNAKFLNINSNQFDRAGGPNLKIYSTGERYCRNITVNGNQFFRGGMSYSPAWRTEGEQSCHLYVENCVNFVCTANAFHSGRDGIDENGNRVFGPDYGIVLRHLRASIIKDNAMQSASVRQNILDLGGHEEANILADNPGDVMESPERWTAMLADRQVDVIRSYFDLTEDEKKEMGIS